MKGKEEIRTSSSYHQCQTFKSCLRLFSQAKGQLYSGLKMEGENCVAMVAV